MKEWKKNMAFTNSQKIIIISWVYRHAPILHLWQFTEGFAQHSNPVHPKRDQNQQRTPFLDEANGTVHVIDLS